MALTVGENSYVSVADADSYFADRLFVDAWDNADESTKAKALIMATRQIGRVPLIGRVVDFEQALAFPRYVLGPDGWYEQEEVPQAVIYATCEEALALLEQSSDDRQRRRLQQAGVSSFSLGTLSESYKNVRGKLASQEAREYLSPYIAGSVLIR